ncbi:MAG: metallophosphoesterase [Gracilimonas sp.]
MKFEQHLFLSDVHIGAFSDATNQLIEKDLISLIKHCQKNKIALYILGDLFDYWMEYPDQNFVPKLGKKVLNTFEEYNRTVNPALYITGNHDNWTFGHFEERGFELEPDYRLFEINDKQFLLMHGDGVSSDTIEFPRAKFHRLLRNSKFVHYYQKYLSPKVGVNIMKLFSALTRKRNHSKLKPLNQIAEKLLKEHKLDFILTGHDHIPRVETFSCGSYINLGTFCNHRTVALYNNEGMQLVTWSATSKNFIPFEGNN